MCIVRVKLTILREEIDGLARGKRHNLLDCFIFAERVKALQAEANAGTVEMVQDLDKGLLALLDQVNELEGLKTPIVGIEAMVRELKPQIERWSVIVGGIAGKHKGR